jgi:ribosomal protein RSM22 (predicted rRNA methylase)
VKHWSPSDLAVLRRLRARFLAGDAAAGDYWDSREDLALYDETFAERIGWKWDAVLRELECRQWRPQSRNMVDFGCGSGVASRRVLEAWPGQFATLTLHDRSLTAMKYAAEQVRNAAGPVQVHTAQAVTSLPYDTVLVVSHVLNELPPETLSRLLHLAGQAREILWVEAGAHAESRRLIAEVREPLLAVGTHHVVAPCTHQAACGMRVEVNAPHWCHSFARVPSEAFQSGRWTEFSRELGIDLRALPYSFLALERVDLAAKTASGCSRIIGRPREYKGYSKILSCQAEGVTEFTLQKRDDPELLKTIQKEDEATIYRWTMEGSKIRKGERMPGSGDGN